jgi:hypothetical protein
MKLAFALMAAINGSTGSSATLSSGLQLPHQASPASTRRHVEFSIFMGGGARPPGTLSCEFDGWRERSGRVVCAGGAPAVEVACWLGQAACSAGSALSSVTA